jgi:class 3 adenylate cyclase/predicted ATPase
MEFEEVLEQTIALLQRQGRISYGALKRRFKLDDAYLEDLKVELIEAQQLAHDENGRILVWSGGPVPTSPPTPEPVLQPSHTSQQLHTQEDRPPGEPAYVARRIPAAERRQLTVMFCDLVDSTALAVQLDPEDLREVVRAYQETSAAMIQRFGGYIAQYLGDGLLVYFGYPQAHEDDAQRAVRAGLGLAAAMGELNARLAQRTGIRLAVRIGIHTGLVVVGEMGGGSRQEQLALGETPNVAARIQGLAAPDTVVISPATLRLVRGYFTCQDLGSHTLKGLAAPLQVYRILGESAAQSRLEVAEASGFTPLVGRESEVALLLERWAQSQEGRGQVVLLRGEAGIGKSRLVEALRRRAMHEGATRIAFRCSPYYQNSALYPVIDHLQRFLQWQRDDTPEAKLDTLERVLRTYRLPLDDVMPLFAALLSVPLPECYPALNLTPQRQRQKTQEALVAWLLEETERQPVLAVWEDLHWADPSTLEWLSLVLDQAPTTRMLTLLTCRPELRPPWGPQAPVTQVILNRLGHIQIETMIPHLTGGKALPAEVVQQVVVKTDGIPLFVEELVKMILESGLVREEADRYVLTGPLPPLAIPSTLHDSLMARLDRLSAARDLAQLGAVLGREFTYELLQAVSPLDETTLQQGLAQLVDAELVYQRGRLPQCRYIFKHALIQEAAYQSLLRSTRQRYHQRTAQMLEAQFPETVETQPELVAHHATEAALGEQAVRYWQRAGQRAIERSANLEAISHLTKGLEILTTLPDSTEHMQQEILLQTALASTYIAVKGGAAPEVERAYVRARELCQQMGDTAQLIPVLGGLRRHYSQRAEYQQVRELGEQLLHLAQHRQDPVALLEAHLGLGLTLWDLGELIEARTHLEQGIVLYDRQQDRSLAFRYGRDPGVTSRYATALVLWLLGYPSQALQRSHEAIRLAQELSHAYSLALALYWAAECHRYRREEQAAHERVEAAIALSTEQGFTQYLVRGTILRGGVLAAQGQSEVGIAQMRQGLAAFQTSGGGVSQPSFLALLAEAYGQGGQVEEGLRVLAEALILVEKTGDRFWKAELYRFKGELLLQQARTRRRAKGTQHPWEEAEGCLHQALDIAHRQQAKSLELRAAMSLSRLWQQQNKRTEAHQLLAEIYGWFTEGFDTADLQDAKALLEELA